MLFIDLDDFKTVNDSLGHSAGDDLLRIVSDRLTSCLRQGDTAARLGGDEFAVLIDDLDDPEVANLIADRIVTTLQEPVVLGFEAGLRNREHRHRVRLRRSRADEMLRNADLAMYTAKGSGKNCVRVFERAMHLAAVERLDLEVHLRGAAERGELVMHYQPIYELRTGRIIGFEALVRWQHPERGLLGPMSFIPFAEAGGLIDEIGNHVLLTACEEAGRWSRAVGEAAAPAISVNVSPRQLLDADLPERVESLLDRCGLEPDRLILEITEGALIKDPDAAAAKLKSLSETRCAARGRRLRHRLLVARLPPAVPDRHAQDRPLVRERHARERELERRRAPGIAGRGDRADLAHARTWSRSPRAWRARRRPTRWPSSDATSRRASISVGPPTRRDARPPRTRHARRRRLGCVTPALPHIAVRDPRPDAPVTVEHRVQIRVTRADVVSSSTSDVRPGPRVMSRQPSGRRACRTRRRSTTPSMPRSC